MLVALSVNSGVVCVPLSETFPFLCMLVGTICIILSSTRTSFTAVATFIVISE